MKNVQNIQIFSRVNFVDILFFTKHLSIMIKSGITIFESVDILASETQSEAFRKVLTALRNDLANGQPISKALEKHPHVFSSFYISLIAIGEESGKLEENLDYLAIALAKEYSFRRKIKGALIYPSIIVAFMILVGIPMVIFVLPKLTELFEQLDIDLPLTTRLLIGFADVMKHYGIFIFASLIGIFLLARLLIQVHEPLRRKWHAYLLAMPIFGNIIRNAQLTYFFRNLGVMLKSGLPIIRSFDIAYKTTDNLIFKDYIKRLQDAIIKGKDIAKELESHTYKKIPPIAVKMIGVGEKTGELDETLLYLGDFFEEEVDSAAKNMTTTLEPILLLIVGVIVAFVAMAIITPIYEFTGSIKR